ncbi:hypothetical protein [Paenibacillus dendritiformis]|uniref:hypothetical protein n=1 Tax=Paenibacillus dendritiformis TaxID=130049 RepID=UPI0018CD35D1|nr:hypothetical protein [Paenibacillus dendritiformis]
MSIIRAIASAKQYDPIFSQLPPAQTEVHRLFIESDVTEPDLMANIQMALENTPMAYPR